MMISMFFIVSQTISNYSFYEQKSSQYETMNRYYYLNLLSISLSVFLISLYKNRNPKFLMTIGLQIQIVVSLLYFIFNFIKNDQYPYIIAFYNLGFYLSMDGLLLKSLYDILSLRVFLVFYVLQQSFLVFFVLISNYLYIKQQYKFYFCYLLIIFVQLQFVEIFIFNGFRISKGDLI